MNLAWVFMISLDVTLFNLVVIDRPPTLVNPPLLYIYLVIGIGLVILMHKLVNEQKKFKDFIIDILDLKPKPKVIR